MLSIELYTVALYQVSQLVLDRNLAKNVSVTKVEKFVKVCLHSGNTV